MMNYYAGQETPMTGLDVGLPPWWAVVPIAAPLGVAKWGADTAKRNLGFGGSGSSQASLSDWSGVAKIALVVGLGVVGYFAYRGIRSSFAMSGHAIRGGIRGLRDEEAMEAAR